MENVFSPVQMMNSASIASPKVSKVARVGRRRRRAPNSCMPRIANTVRNRREHQAEGEDAPHAVDHRGENLAEGLPPQPLELREDARRGSRWSGHAVRARAEGELRDAAHHHRASTTFQGSTSTSAGPPRGVGTTRDEHAREHRLARVQRGVVRSLWRGVQRHRHGVGEITKITNRWNPRRWHRFARRRNRPHAVARSFFSSPSRARTPSSRSLTPDSLFRTSRGPLSASRLKRAATLHRALISMPTPSTSTTPFFAPGSVSSSSSSAAPRFLLRRRAPRRSRASCASITSEVAQRGDHHGLNSCTRSHEENDDAARNARPPRRRRSSPRRARPAVDGDNIQDDHRRPREVVEGQKPVHGRMRETQHPPAGPHAHPRSRTHAATPPETAAADTPRSASPCSASRRSASRRRSRRRTAR